MYFPIIDVLKENFIAKIPSIVTQWLTDNVDPVGSAVVVDESLSISGAAADAKVTGDELNDLKSDLTFLLNSYRDISFTPNSYINYTNGEINSLNDSSVSSAINVFEGLKLKLKNYASYQASDGRGLVFYDKNNTYVSGVQLTGSDVSITVPQNAATMKFTVGTENIATYDLLVDLSPLLESYYPTLTDVSLLKNDSEILSVQYTTGGYVNNVQKNITSLNGFSYSELITLYKGQGIQVKNGVSSTKTVVDELSRWDANGNYIESLHAYQTSYTAEDTLVYVATHDVEYVRVCYFSYQGWDIVVLRYNNNTKRISEIQSEALNNLYPSISMFSKVGFCGDSYVRGQIWVGDSSYDHPELSWGSDIGRRAGITAQIYASSGANTALYLTRSECLPAILADATPCGLYVFCLGINDSSTVATGTIADITNYESYEDYPNTFYGNYGKIIEQILEYSPNSKIIIMTPYLPEFNERYVTPITEITEHYNIAMINTMNSKLCENSTLFVSRLVHSHPTAPLYSAMARDIEFLIGKCISDNYDYFKNYMGIT